ncbi:hypothetical protein LRD69_27555 [Streptomyces sp. JH14]|uniref:alpha/beta hydrolase domain-containing protein n=1 Tax=Streptomyces sp. JH14 TaxID=2793630 RepID=UPI0023F7811F|nr:alpha/beta hydrolase domain-containing protein [Streptomyces sp. JH14]MDF6045832.1 hypothetical protein [Streptomyces sp. JH14]
MSPGPKHPVHLEMHSREPFATGHRFPGAGAYEVLTATAHYTVDPKAAANRAIPDLDLAPRDTTGNVRFSGDVEILRPIEGGRRRLFFEWGNRGNKRAVQYFCDAPHTNRPRTLADAGNGYLMRRGYTIVFGAWQGDLLPGDGRLLLEVPVAKRGTEPVRGLTTAEFIVERPTDSLPLSRWSSTRSYPVTEWGAHTARLTRRRYPHSTPEELPAGTWRFARLQGGGSDLRTAATAVVPSRYDLHVDGGFRPGWIYELTYEAEEPLVLGLGLAAVRDLVTHLRHDPAQPAGPVDYAYGWGRSQTGRAIRDFIHLGFNEDSEGRPVFDGLLPHVSGAGWLGGDRIPRLVELATGLDIEQAIFAALAGRPAGPAEPTATAIVRFFTFPPGRVDEIHGLETAARLGHVDELTLRLCTGDTVPAVVDSKSRHGHVIVFGASPEDARARCAEVLAAIEVVIDDTPVRADGRVGALGTPV